MHDNSFQPRPEYPRPDRRRGTTEGVDWLNLNGPWQFRFDGENCGIHESWFSSHANTAWRDQIIVPFCWESLAAWGEGDAAGNDNYYATRVFRNPLEVTRQNHRTAPRFEIGWYRREIEIPSGDAWTDKRTILNIGAADFLTDCWCNGVHLGRHEGGYTPFEFDLTDALRAAPMSTHAAADYAVIVLRVEDPLDNREQPVGKQWQWYTTTSGIWQTVWIEPRGAAWIESFRITPDIDRATATFEIECENTSDEDEIALLITTPETASFKSETLEVSFPVQNGAAKYVVETRPLVLWDPNHPHLYNVAMRLQKRGTTSPDMSTHVRETSEKNDSTAIQAVQSPHMSTHVAHIGAHDLVHTYFGMRKIDAMPTDEADAPSALRINGEPRYLRGALYQSYHCDGVYTAGDAQVLRDDIAFAQKAGFNFLRVHIKIDDPLLLYYADTMGILLMEDFPNFGEGGDTPLGRRRFEEMMRAAIKRDYNHPSIVAWCLFNETWGFGGQVELVKRFPVPGEKPLPDAVEDAPPIPIASDMKESESGGEADDDANEEDEVPRVANQSAHLWVQNIWEIAKTLDGTRLIEDMSVVDWEHLNYFAHGDTDINSWHFYIDDYEKAKKHIEKVVADTYKGSSFNYVEGYKQGNQPLINSEYGGVGALSGDRDTSWSFKFLTNELRRHGSISAYIYTELTDVEWEYNGLLNYDRTGKEFGYDPQIINAADVLPVDAPPIARHAPGEIVQVPVASSHYALLKREDVSLRWQLNGIDSLGRFHSDLSSGRVPIAFPHRRVADAHTIEMKMPDETMLCTLSLQALASDGQIFARNFVEHFASPGYPYNREEGERLLVLRGAPADWDRSEWSLSQSEREGSRVADRCFGRGEGFFEWALPLEGANLWEAVRLRVLCEASSRRLGSSQTDGDTFPTTLQISLNGVRVYFAVVPDHPHDARGSLSYLRGARGAHGYLAHATIEGDLLRQIAEQAGDGYLRLRCEVPPDALTQGGLTIYGAECGRYPVTPTVIVEW